MAAARRTIGIISYLIVPNKRAFNANVVQIREGEREREKARIENFATCCVCVVVVVVEFRASCEKQCQKGSMA